MNTPPYLYTTGEKQKSEWVCFTAAAEPACRSTGSSTLLSVKSQRVGRSTVRSTDWYPLLSVVGRSSCCRPTSIPHSLLNPKELVGRSDDRPILHNVHIFAHRLIGRSTVLMPCLLLLIFYNINLFSLQQGLKNSIISRFRSSLYTFHRQDQLSVFPISLGFRPQACMHVGAGAG